MYKLADQNYQIYRRGQVYKYVPRHVENKRHKTARNPVVVGFALLIWACVLFFATLINAKNFLQPVYLNRVHNRNIHLEAEKIYPPTLNYISNSNLMGKNLLIAPSVKNTEKLLKINSTGNIESLNSNLHSILAQYPKLHAGIFVYDYISGKTVEINSDEIFPAASIIKIPVLLDLFNRSKKLEDEGFSPVDINEKMTFTEAHRTEGSGNLQYKSAGVDYSLDYLAKIMIRQSDNSATNMLLEYNGGINEINSSLRRWGFTKTQVNSFLPDLQGKNSTSPREIATLLYNIDNQNFLPLKSSASIKEYMSKVENRTLIKSQLPPDAIIIHKTGDIGKMLGDAGIVYSPSGRKYIMSIMVKRPHNDYSARDLIQKAAKAVYDTLGK